VFLIFCKITMQGAEKTSAKTTGICMKCSENGCLEILGLTSPASHWLVDESISGDRFKCYINLIRTIQMSALDRVGYLMQSLFFLTKKHKHTFKEVHGAIRRT
jgi:hypothetical protein